MHKVEVQIKQEKNRNKAFQMEEDNYNQEIGELKNKIKEWERKYQAVVKEH